MRPFIRLALAIVLAGMGLAALVAAMTPSAAQIAMAFHGEAGPLPKFTDLCQRSFIYDASGNEIDQLFIENREPFRLEQVPPDVVDAVLAVEDAGFYSHKGVNAKGLLRAVLANVNNGGATQGGSTITQQLVKNAFVGAKRDADRKIKEAVLAVRLEREYSKEFILERYLNTIYFGNNAYGLEAAAETYFDKTVEQLDLYEGAFLAGLIRKPSGYDPITRADQARGRFKEVLQRLVAVKKITPDEATDKAVTWKLPDTLKRPTSAPRPKDYFTDEVRQQLLTKTSLLGDTYDERKQKLFCGGLKVYTTLNPQLQAAAQTARDAQLPPTPNNRIDAAVASLDTKTSAVVALVGGRDYQTSQVDLALTPRQTGSAVKGFILAAAVNAGIQANDIIDGSAPCTWYDDSIPGGKYLVNDVVSASTSSTMADITARSIDCAYIRLYLSVGGPRIIETMHRMGIKGKLDDIFSFAVGGNEISPLDMAAGYATIANNGVQHDPYYIERIEQGGQVVYQHDDAGRAVFSPEVAATTIDMLKGVIRYGTGTRAQLADNRPQAGKTGTYTDDKHAWFAGFTPQYTTAVYVGNPRYEDPMVNIPEFVNAPAPFQRISRVQGGSYPALIWKAYSDVAYYGLPGDDWAPPPAPPRAPMRVFAPGQDCFGVYIYPAAPKAAEPTDPTDTTPTTAAPAAAPVLSRTNVTVPPFAVDPNDLTGPAAVIDRKYASFSCKNGPPPPPRPVATTPKATTTTAPGSPTTTAANGTATTVKSPTTTKKP